MEEETIGENRDIAGVMNLFPRMHPDMLETFALHYHAIILYGNALGGVAKDLIPTIKKITDSGVPVFMLSDNYNAGHGVIRFVDQPQLDARDNGVTYLEKPNITNYPEVCEAVRQGVNEGLRGADLGIYVQNRFKYQEGEKPETPLGTEAGLEDFKKRVDREIGLT